MERITHKKQLIELAKKLKVRESWHEPDEQDLDAKVTGYEFDNAGFDDKEMMIVIFKNSEPIAKINLATLFAIASSDDYKGYL